MVALQSAGETGHPPRHSPGGSYPLDFGGQYTSARHDARKAANNPTFARHHPSTQDRV
jgi:hypothetical protein